MARFDAASPWSPGESLFAWRAARPLQPDIAARQSSLELREAMRWPATAEPLDPLRLLDPRAQHEIERGAASIAAAARSPSRSALREASHALAACVTPGERERLASASFADSRGVAPVEALLHWLVRNTPEIAVLESALAVLAARARAPDLALAEVLAGQADLAGPLLEIVERAHPPAARRRTLLLRIAATSRGDARSDAIHALAPFARDPEVARWLVCAHSEGASLEAMARIAEVVDFAEIDTLTSHDPALVVGWLHLFSRWFQDDRNATSFRDGVARIGSAPAAFAIPDVAHHVMRLLTRLEKFPLEGPEAIDALTEASALRERIRRLSSIPERLATHFAGRLDWERRIEAWMAQPAHRVQLDRALADPTRARLGLLSSLAEEVWGDDPLPLLMAALREGHLYWLWTTLWKTKTRAQMEELAAWAQAVLAIDDDGTLDRSASPLAGIEQPGVRMGGIAAFREPKLADGVRQTLSQVVDALKRFSGVGTPLVLAALRSEDELLEGTAMRALEAWSENDRAAVMRRLPRRQ